MDSADYCGLIVVCCMIGLIGLMTYDATNYSTSIEIITPINIVPDGDKVMDECFNIYYVYHPYYGDENSLINLMYCKEHNLQCEITIATHMFGNQGIKFVKILDAQKPNSCNRGDE